MLPPQPFEIVTYYTDAFATYQALTWPGEHQVSVGKRNTYTVAGMNSPLRHYLARLRRKTKCYSKSREKWEEAIKLFAWGWNQRQQQLLANPKLKHKLNLL